MKMRLFAVVFVLLGTLAIMPSISANAQLDYGFKVGTGRRVTGDFRELQYGSRAGAGQESGWGYAIAADWVGLDFVFNFNGNEYREVVVSSNGLIMLGQDLGIGSFNDLSGVGGDVIAPFWDAMRVRSGGNGCEPSSIHYAVVGDEPNRIFVVDYDQMGLSQGQNGINSIGTFQVRLYEGSNKIEFYYDHMDPSDQSCNMWGGGANGTVSTSASIGLATPDAMMSITPNNSTATSSTSSVNNEVDAGSISDGVLYTFCPAGLKGDVNQGGTDRMANGDTLLLGREVTLSSSQVFTPFVLRSLCASNFTYTITGPHVAEYSITPSNGSLPEDGSMPVLRFAPTGIGVRYATLRVVDNENFVNRTFVLAGEGVPRTTWIGNIAQGGTATMRDGDTLFRNIALYNGLVQDYTPLTINIAPGGNTPAPITYTLTDPTGQFRIDRTSQNVMPGGNSTPVITFAPTGVGFQTARLVVNAEGEVRTYVLQAFASGAGALFFVGGEPLMAGASVFRSVAACVGGTTVATTEVIVENIGDEPFLIETSNAYQTENIIKQGTPPFELLRDDFGNLVPVEDYFISAAPGSRTPLTLPIIIPEGARQTIYLNFLPTRSGKRQARAFFRTNGLNFFGINPDKTPVQGMLNFEFVGVGQGASLTNAAGAKLPDAVVFPSTDVRSTSTVTAYLRNNGECDMLIPAADLRLVSGDVNEFSIASELTAPKDALGNYVIAPGRTESFTVNFTPTRSGSRRASIFVRTNDSSLFQRGLSERGVYYLDVFGVGKVGLEARSVSLPPAVIAGPGSRGVVVLENTSGEIATITNIRIVGGGAEIVEDPANMWPALPVTITPGKTQSLGLAFNPIAPAGLRRITVEVTLAGGAILTIDVEGLAGTREVVVAPTSLFQNLQVNVGEVRRQFLAVTNSGTFPITIQQLRLAQTNPGDYTVSALARNVLQPGQVEFVEVTYTPQAVGISSGTLEVVSNATNGPHIVQLGGQGTSTAPPLGGGASGSSIAVPGEGTSAIRPGTSLSGWSAAMENGTLLWQSSPNPTATQAEIRYYLPAEDRVAVHVYSTNGELVKEVLTEVQEAGEHQVVVDVRTLPSGRYYYTLRTASGVLTLAFDVIK